MLTWEQYEKFDKAIAKEKNNEIRLYFLYRRSLVFKEYENCYEYVIKALNEKCINWNAIDSFIETVLPSLMKSKKYERVCEMAESILGCQGVGTKYRQSIYHILGNALYALERGEELSKLIDRIQFEEKYVNHPLVKWYREAQRTGEFRESSNSMGNRTP
jgi:hypothetical protein